jgi:stress-induced morphogen
MTVTIVTFRRFWKACDAWQTNWLKWYSRCLKISAKICPDTSQQKSGLLTQKVRNLSGLGSSLGGDNPGSSGNSQKSVTCPWARETLGKDLNWVRGGPRRRRKINDFLSQTMSAVHCPAFSCQHLPVVCLPSDCQLVHNLNIHYIHSNNNNDHNEIMVSSPKFFFF